MELNEAYYSHFFIEEVFTVIFTKLLPTIDPKCFEVDNKDCFTVTIPINLN